MATRFTYFRQFFSVKLSHNIAPGKICEAFSLVPDSKTERLLLDKKMKYKTEPGKIALYYSGDSDPANVPPINDDKMIAFPGIENNTEFIFIIDVTNNKIMKKTLVPSPKTNPAFDLKKLGQAVPWYYVKQSVFNVLFDKAVSAKIFEQFNVKDIQNKIVITSDVRKNDQGDFQCSVDMSDFVSGFYSVELGTGKENFYLDSESEMTDKYGFIRFVKDNTWSNPNGIYDKNEYNIFNYEFPKATYAIAI